MKTKLLLGENARILSKRSVCAPNCPCGGHTLSEFAFVQDGKKRPILVGRFVRFGSEPFYVEGSN